jgi:hypothetical protein
VNIGDRGDADSFLQKQRLTRGDDDDDNTIGASSDVFVISRYIA